MYVFLDDIVDTVSMASMAIYRSSQFGFFLNVETSIFDCREVLVLNLAKAFFRLFILMYYSA